MSHEWTHYELLNISDWQSVNLTEYPNKYPATIQPPYPNGTVNIGDQANLFAIDSDLQQTFYITDILKYVRPGYVLGPDQYLMGIEIDDEDGNPTGYGLGWFRNTNNDGIGVWFYDVATKTEIPGANVFNGAWGGFGAIKDGAYYIGIYKRGSDITWCCANNIYDWNYPYNVRADIKSYEISPDQFLWYWSQQLGVTLSKFSMKVTISSDAFGDASTPEGYSGGTFDDSSDTISIPTAPTIGVSSAGFVNVYNPSPSALTGFGSELFPNLSFTPVSSLPAPTDVQTALENIATVLTDFGNQIPNIIDMYINSNLIQYVLDCHIIPVAPAVGSAAGIKVGFRTFSQTAPEVTSDYIDFDCGSLNVGEYYANYIDYAPFTSAKLFLPFVGFVDMLPEYWQSGTLSVTYRFNVIDGSFVAFVKSTSSKSKLSDTVIGQYGGNCCVHIPLTGANYSNMVSGLVSGAAAVLTAGAGAAAKVSAAVSSAVNVAQSRPSVQQSNGYNSTTSFLGVRTPYLLIERSVSSFSENYATENGLPSNVTATLSSLSGYTEASDLILSGIDATDAELNEIAALLASGVIL